MKPKSPAQPDINQLVSWTQNPLDASSSSSCIPLPLEVFAYPHHKAKEVALTSKPGIEKRVREVLKRGPLKHLSALPVRFGTRNSQLWHSISNETIPSRTKLKATKAVFWKPLVRQAFRGSFSHRKEIKEQLSFSRRSKRKQNSLIFCPRGAKSSRGTPQGSC
jgi:hypothetical protein